MSAWCQKCGHFYTTGLITHEANCKLQKRKRWDTMSLIEKADFMDGDMRRDKWIDYLHSLLKAIAKEIKETKK